MNMLVNCSHLYNNYSEEELGDSEEDEQEEGDDYKDQEDNMEEDNEEGTAKNTNNFHQLC